MVNGAYVKWSGEGYFGEKIAYGLKNAEVILFDDLQLMLESSERGKVLELLEYCKQQQKAVMITMDFGRNCL